MNQVPDLVVPTRLLEPLDRGGFDLVLPEQDGRPPVVVLVHGLFQEPPPVSPRRTPFFRAYAAQLAQRGVAAVVFDHELTGGMRYPEAAATLDRVLSAVPLLANRPDGGEWLARLVQAALADEAGKSLEGALGTVRSLSD